MAVESGLCRLLALPAEIRTAIWELLLVTNASIHSQTSQHRASSNFRTSTRPSAAILRTCKQIHLEATPILYGANIFLAHPSLLSALPRLFHARSTIHVTAPSLPVTHARMTALVRRFYLPVRLDVDPGFSRATVEQSFSGCDSLALDVFQAMYGSCDLEVLRLFEGVRGVGHATVVGSVGDGKYARWLEKSMMSPIGAPAIPFD